MSASAPPDRVRRGRGAAERDVRARLLDREDVAHEVVEAVVLALVVERLVGGPGLLDDLDVLAGAGVALVLGEGVALAALLVVVAAGDEVDGQPAVADLVEGGERLGGERRVGHVRAVGEQDLQTVRPARDVRGRRRGVRRCRSRRRTAPGPSRGPRAPGRGGACSPCRRPHRSAGWSRSRRWWRRCRGIRRAWRRAFLRFPGAVSTGGPRTRAGRNSPAYGRT